MMIQPPKVDIPEGHMALHSGRSFNPETFSLEDFHIRDVAHALAQTARYGGHANRFYSVAEHCVHIHDLFYPKGCHPIRDATICDPVKALFFPHLSAPCRRHRIKSRAR